MAGKEKSPKKSPQKRVLKPRPGGRGALMTGGTNKGGTGRPPDEFKRAMAELASSDDVLRHVRNVLNDPSHPQWLGAWKWATERGYGKTPDQLDVTSGGEKMPALLQVAFVRASRGDADG